MSTETIVEIALDQLQDSPFNRTIREAGLAELAASIKAEGRIHEPLLVRPIVPPLFAGDPDGQAGFEIVFGHRRRQSAILAGLATAPCMVRTMSDEEARRAQIAENLQREDVHPIEEAESFQTLIDTFGYTADRIAEEQGKSRSYVYGRLKLLQACPRVRKACLAGEIGSEVALLVARLRTEKLQTKALEYIDKDYRASLTDGGAKSFRAIRDMLNEKFTLELKRAIFPIEDATLLPEAGDCPACPKRSGNAPEFDDVVAGDQRPTGVPAYAMRERMDHTGANVCTDPDCFDAKKKAHLKREQLALEEKGKTVIAGAKARTIVGADGDVKGGYVDAAKVRDLIKKAKADVAIATVQNPRDGKTRQVVKLEDLKAAGVKVAEPKPTTASRDSYAVEEKKREEKAKAATDVNLALLDRVRAAAVQRPRDLADLQLVAAALWEGVDWDDAKSLAKLHGVDDPRNMPKQIEQLTADGLGMLMLDCVLIQHVYATGWQNHEPKALLATAKRYGIETLEKRATVEHPKPMTKAQILSPQAAWPFPKPAREATAEAA